MYDPRLVKNAVMGAPNSRHLVYLPPFEQAARHFKSRFYTQSFYCGRVVGGCGERLTIKISSYQTCHFAHYPSTFGPRCVPNPQRIARFVSRRGIGAWLTQLDVTDGDWAEDDYGIEFTYQACPRRLRIELASYGRFMWQQRQAAAERDGVQIDWLFYVDEDGPWLDDIIQRFGRIFVLRTVVHDFEPMLEIGTVIGNAEPVWEPLSDCLYVPEYGIMTNASEMHVGAAVLQPKPVSALQALSSTTAPTRMRPPVTTRPTLEAQAEAVRAALQLASQRRTKITWDELDEILGGLLRRTGLTDRERTDLLVGVERLAKPGGAHLSVLLVEDHTEDRAIENLRDVLEARGICVPTDETAFSDWRRNEFERAISETLKGTQQNEVTYHSPNDMRTADIQESFAYVVAQLRLTMTGSFGLSTETMLQAARVLRGRPDADDLGAERLKVLDGLIDRAVILRFETERDRRLATEARRPGLYTRFGFHS